MSILKAILPRLFKVCVRKVYRAEGLIVISFLISNLVAAAQVPPSREYQLKAAFLFNFTQFVEWPSHSFTTDHAPMVIGIVGTDPFGSYLQETIAGEKMNGHPLTIQHFKETDEIGPCQILFINIADKKKREQVLARLKGRNILTVSDAPDFMHQGGMIRFFTKNDKIKLEVNLGASKIADLIISSKLLRLVEIFDAQKSS